MRKRLRTQQHSAPHRDPFANRVEWRWVESHFTGTSRFNSSNQLSVILISLWASRPEAPVSPRITTNFLPSGVMSYGRTMMLRLAILSIGNFDGFAKPKFGVV